MSGSSSKRRVVITGHGMITPLGNNTEETFTNCRQGRSGIDYITSFNTSGLPCRIGGEVDNEWFKKFEQNTDQKLSKFSSRALRLMRAATSEAVTLLCRTCCSHASFTMKKKDGTCLSF
jgi:3-oxoacyl-[acyl-carrier-protein] synthase II